MSFERAAPRVTPLVNYSYPLKGEEPDSDDETLEFELNSKNAFSLYEQWQKAPNSVKIEAYVQTRNPFCPTLKMKQCLPLSLTESSLDESKEFLFLRFVPSDGQTVYYAYDANGSYSTVKILLFKKGEPKQVLALEKIFFASSIDIEKRQFSSLNGRIKPDVVPLKQGEILPLIESALQELSIPPAWHTGFILSQKQIGIENIHSLKSLIYRVSM